jgi:hypothetical protein
MGGQKWTKCEKGGPFHIIIYMHTLPQPTPSYNSWGGKTAGFTPFLTLENMNIFF